MAEIMGCYTADVWSTSSSAENDVEGLKPEADFKGSNFNNMKSKFEITYGSVIKLMHKKTKFRLHSHNVPYGSGSGQQSVTGFPNVDDANSYWVHNIFIPSPETSMKAGDNIKAGTIIRLQHLKTKKWLHSHLHGSPISGNLEICVTTFVCAAQMTRRHKGLQTSADVKKQTVFLLQTADVWATSSSAELCRHGPQTADVLTLKKQTAP
ncbi:hypothetical protein LXL04_038829 [Taraxacum kok-saghyz]